MAGEIVVGYDGSDCAKAAVVFAADVATRLRRRSVDRLLRRTTGCARRWRSRGPAAGDRGPGGGLARGRRGPRARSRRHGSARDRRRPSGRRYSCGRRRGARCAPHRHRHQQQRSPRLGHSRLDAAQAAAPVAATRARGAGTALIRLRRPPSGAAAAGRTTCRSRARRCSRRGSSSRAR